jgi:hypothetical protein
MRTISQRKHDALGETEHEDRRTSHFVGTTLAHSNQRQKEYMCEKQRGRKTPFMSMRFMKKKER